MGVEGEDGEDEDEISTVEMAHRIEYTMMFKSLYTFFNQHKNF